MLKYLIFLLNILNINKAYRILFAPSTNVKPCFYSKFIKRLENKINTSIQFLNQI